MQPTHKQGYTAESDPHGTDPHSPGAKLDHGKNRLGLVLNGFPLALMAVGEVGTYGANKYTDNGWKQVPDGINRYTDAMYRHLFAEAAGQLTDSDTELLHAAHAAWNALARLNLMLEGKG
ncbi:dATP/dGTP diphosphohydrolase domain-containing protein [Pontibacter sp. JAM-7]|uniref:dATP/dGTP diphosphohydrolase domain-containing protein n=1 Tax=Pontibacter sp. JAM-7 TaxID=3366581 RepID=UPI003AF5228D